MYGAKFKAKLIKLLLWN